MCVCMHCKREVYWTPLACIFPLTQAAANSQSDWSSITSEEDAIVLFQLLVDWLWGLKVCVVQ